MRKTLKNSLMRREIIITDFESFINFIEGNNLNSNEICELCERAFKLFADNEKPPGVLIEEIKEYWEKYSNTKEKPIFLNLNIEVENTD